MTVAFIDVYDKIWELLEADSEFTAMVKKGNRIKITGDSKIKPGIQDGDIPQVYIGATTGDGGTISNRKCDMSKAYPIIISSGDQNATTSMSIEWLVIGILTRGFSDIIDIDGVRDVDIIASNTQLVQEEIVRLAFKGYTSVVTLRVMFNIERRAAVPTPTPTPTL